MLHVLNGEAALKPLKRAAVPGEFMVWREMLMEGPLKRGRDGSLDWKARAAYLSVRYGIDAKSHLIHIQSFFQSLHLAADSGRQVVFWFEEDFFHQIHLVFLLAHLPKGLRSPGRTRIICLDKELCNLGPRDMERLFMDRRPLDQGLQTLSRKAWKAFAKQDATALKRLIGKSGPGAVEGFGPGRNFASWPLLKRGLLAYLGAKPPAGRVGSVEAAILRCLAAGNGKRLRFRECYRRVTENPGVKSLGLGEMQVARLILDMAGRKQPSLTIGKGAPPRMPKEISGLSRWHLSLINWTRKDA